MSRKRRCEQSSFNPYRRSPFLVFKSKFALRSQRIPCYVAQGIYRQLPDIASYSYIGFISEGPKTTKFPVLFPVSREFRSSRPVWQDYVDHLEVRASPRDFLDDKIAGNSRSRRLGPHKTIHNRFVRWSRLGVFNKIFAALAHKGGKPERVMIDATHLKAHRTAASLLKKGLFPDVSGAPKAA
jgi:transposase